MKDNTLIQIHLKQPASKWASLNYLEGTVPTIRRISSGNIVYEPTIRRISSGNIVYEE